MGLLNGGLRTVFGAALAGLYLDALLYPPDHTSDGKGGGTSGWGSPIACKAQLDRVTQAQAQGGVDADQRIIVLAAGLDETITTDHEITVEGVRWAISAVSRDPAQAYYDLRGYRAATDAAGDS